MNTTEKLNTLKDYGVIYKDNMQQFLSIEPVKKYAKFPNGIWLYQNDEEQEWDFVDRVYGIYLILLNSETKNEVPKEKPETRSGGAWFDTSNICNCLNHCENKSGCVCNNKIELDNTWHTESVSHSGIRTITINLECKNENDEKIAESMLEQFYKRNNKRP